MLCSLKSVAVLLYMRFKNQLSFCKTFIMIHTCITFISGMSITSWFFFGNFIKYFSYLYNVLHGNYVNMMYSILENLQLVFFLIVLFIKDLKKVFMSYFTICYIIVYYVSVVLNLFIQVCYSMEFWIIKIVIK